jgi:hypothetical protein
VVSVTILQRMLMRQKIAVVVKAMMLTDIVVADNVVGTADAASRDIEKTWVTERIKGSDCKGHHESNESEGKHHRTRTIFFIIAGTVSEVLTRRQFQLLHIITLVVDFKENSI